MACHGSARPGDGMTMAWHGKAWKWCGNGNGMPWNGLERHDNENKCPNIKNIHMVT
jgi:hypothetical protein